MKHLVFFSNALMSYTTFGQVHGLPLTSHIPIDEVIDKRSLSNITQHLVPPRRATKARSKSMKVAWDKDYEYILQFTKLITLYTVSYTQFKPLLKTMQHEASL